MSTLFQHVQLPPTQHYSIPSKFSFFLFSFLTDTVVLVPAAMMTQGVHPLLPHSPSQPARKSQLFFYFFLTNILFACFFLPPHLMPH
jgi:hypothetical protein